MAGASAGAGLGFRGKASARNGDGRAALQPGFDLHSVQFLCSRAPRYAVLDDTVRPKRNLNIY